MNRINVKQTEINITFESTVNAHRQILVLERHSFHQPWLFPIRINFLIITWLQAILLSSSYTQKNLISFSKNFFIHFSFFITVWHDIDLAYESFTLSGYSNESNKQNNVKQRDSSDSIAYAKKDDFPSTPSMILCILMISDNIAISSASAPRRTVTVVQTLLLGWRAL